MKFRSDEVKDAAVLEVRRQATEEQIRLLESNPWLWKVALEEVIDEVESQLLIRLEEFNDTSCHFEPNTEQYQRLEEEFNAWKVKTRTFKRHVTARLLHVKRLCDELGVTPNLEGAKLVGAILEASGAFVDTNARYERGLGSEDEYDSALSALQEAVENYSRYLHSG